MSDIFRPATIAVSAGTHWCYRQIAASNRHACGDLETPEGIDGICEKVLKEHLKEHYPALLELWKRRQAIDDEALAALQKGQK